MGFMVRSLFFYAISSTIRSYAKVVAAVVLYTGAAPCFATQVELVGLFKEKAVLVVDGQRHIVAVGDESPEGVKVVSVAPDHAVLVVDGKRAPYRLGQSGSFSTTYDDSGGTEVGISPDEFGMYHTHGHINGTSIKFLVDTGATTIAISGSQARRLGIDFKREGRRIPIGTASRTEIGFLVKLTRVKVGGIEIYNVPAVVLDGEEPREALLGNSFLNRVEMQRENGVLRLRKK